MNAQVARELQQRVVAKAKAPRLADTLEFIVVTARCDLAEGGARGLPEGLCSRTASLPCLRFHQFL